MEFFGEQLGQLILIQIIDLLLKRHFSKMVIFNYSVFCYKFETFS